MGQAVFCSVCLLNYLVQMIIRSTKVTCDRGIIWFMCFIDAVIFAWFVFKLSNRATWHVNMTFILCLCSVAKGGYGNRFILWKSTEFQCPGGILRQLCPVGKPWRDTLPLKFSSHWPCINIYPSLKQRNKLIRCWCIDRGRLLARQKGDGRNGRRKERQIYRQAHENTSEKKSEILPAICVTHSIDCIVETSMDSDTQV